MKMIAIMRALPLALAAIGGAAQAQMPPTTAFSPGAQYDRQSWSTFITAVTPNGKEVTFETWATDATTYPAQQPATAAARPPSRFQVSRLLSAHLPLSLRRRLAAAANALPVPCAQPPLPGAFPVPTTTGTTDCIAEEVRRNPTSYQHIVSNHLNTQSGLIAAYNKAVQTGYAIPPFPDGSIELKADWVPVPTLISWLANNGVTVTTQQVQSNYFTTTDQGTQYALVAMHIALKTTANPDWIWATFEHQWNPGRCDTMGCYDQYGVAANLASIPPSFQGDAQYPACTKSAALAQQFGAAHLSSVWNNYCLKETEVTFVSAQGQAILNGNSVTERILAGVPISSTSCIACHQNASYTVVSSGTPPTQRAAVNKAIGLNPVGTVTVQSPPYVTYDFVWSFITLSSVFPPQ